MTTAPAAIPVIAWDGAGSGPRRALPAGSNTIMSLRPLPGGDLLVAAQDPWLGRLGADGTARWSHEPQQMDARDQRSNLGLSADGMVVDFGYELWRRRPRPLRPRDAHPERRPARRRPHRPAGAAGPDGHRLGSTARDPGSTASRCRSSPTRSRAASRSHPDGKRFLLGTDWSLRAFDAAGAELWRRPAPGAVWAVNISGDGRLALAAYGDGTLRWHRMEDGAELLALFPLADRANWVAWTPEGVYAASTGARSVLRWHVNRGWDAAGEAIPVSAIPETHRPEVIPLRAAAARHRRRARRRRARRRSAARCRARPRPRSRPARGCTCWRSGSATMAPRRRS